MQGLCFEFGVNLDVVNDNMGVTSNFVSDTDAGTGACTAAHVVAESPKDAVRRDT